MKKEIEENQYNFYKKIIKEIFLNSNNSPLNIYGYLSNSDKFSYSYMEYKLNKKKFFNFFLCYIKNFISIFYFNNYTLHKSQISKASQKLIITWGKKNDFDKKGNFTDRYCGIKSKKQKGTIFIVQYEEDLLPNKISKNIIILKKNKKKFFPLHLIYQIFKDNVSIVKFFNCLSHTSLYAVLFYEKISNELKNINIKKILMPYEGQLCQKYFIKKIKNKNIKTIGLIHTFLQPIAFNIFYNKLYSPDKLIVNSLAQKKCLTKYMNWSENLIVINNSKRFFRSANPDMSRKIFFPYEINNDKILKTFFKKFLIYYKNFLFIDYKVQIHPSKINHIQHLKFKKNISRIISEKKNKMITKSRYAISIFFEYSSAIIEALERGVGVVQICSNPILQVYTSYFWEGIKINKITSNIFEYKPIKKNTLIRMKD